MTATPYGIDLDQYRAQAEDLLKQARAADPASLHRIRSHHPEGAAIAASGRIQLADAQLVVARENDFRSWPRFREHLLYRAAVRAMGEGDTRHLKSLLDTCPRLPALRCRQGEWYDSGYFQGAMLLHHIAGNPNCFPIPPNVAEVARMLLARGADPNARTDQGETTISLLLTSCVASELGVALPLIDLLRSAGAAVGALDAGALDASLLNAAPETAAELVLRGASIEIRHAAGLGWMETLEERLSADASQQELEMGLLFACIRGQEEAARRLAVAGARGDVLLSPRGITPRTALHEAACRGHERIVRVLLDNGADARVVEPHFGGTPAGWARHGEPPHLELAAMLEQAEAR